MIINTAAGKEFDSIWQPFTKDELNTGHVQFWSNLREPGVFDMSRNLIEIGMSFMENRPLTCCELILSMKCDFLAAFRLHAINTHFDNTMPNSINNYECNKNGKMCICSAIPFN